MTICEEIRFVKSDLCSGDHTDASGAGNGSGQPGQADADSHAALNDW
jgi:hypothetical protein